MEISALTSFQIFSIAISGNIANYMQEASTNFHWRYNFHLVSIAATTIVLYVILIPFALWAALKWTARPVDSDLITDEVSDFLSQLQISKLKWILNLDFIVNLLFLLCSQSEWSLHTQFTDIDLHLRLFAWHLYSHIGPLGHSNSIPTMDACIRSCTNNRCCAHHRLEPSPTKFHQICHFNWQHFSGTFPVGRRFYAPFLSYACGSRSNSTSTTSSSSSSRSCC